MCAPVCVWGGVCVCVCVCVCEKESVFSPVKHQALFKKKRDLSFFDAQEKYESYVMMIVWRDKNFNVAIFSDITKITNIKLCMIVLLTELYLFIPLSVTLTTL